MNANTCMPPCMIGRAASVGATVVGTLSPSGTYYRPPQQVSAVANITDPRDEIRNKPIEDTTIADKYEDGQRFNVGVSHAT